ELDVTEPREPHGKAEDDETSAEEDEVGREARHHSALQGLQHRVGTGREDRCQQDSEPDDNRGGPKDPRCADLGLLRGVTGRRGCRRSSHGHWTILAPSTKCTRFNHFGPTRPITAMLRAKPSRAAQTCPSW